MYTSADYLIYDFCLIERWARQPHDEAMFEENMKLLGALEYGVNMIRHQMTEGKRYVNTPWAADWYEHGKEAAPLIAARCRAICESGIADDLAMSVRYFPDSSYPISVHGIIVRAIELPEGFDRDAEPRIKERAKERLLGRLECWGMSNCKGWFV